MAGNFSSKLFGMIIIPIYAKYLTASDLGTFDFQQTIGNLLMPITALAIWEAILRFGLNQSERKTNEVITTSVVISTITIFISSIILLATYIPIYGLSINTILPVVQNPFVNFDPPYVKKGSLLYKNSYSELDHRTLASKVVACSIPWIVTYDICELVKSLYSQFRHTTLGINYSIGDVRDAKEYIFFSDNLALPKILS